MLNIYLYEGTGNCLSRRPVRRDLFLGILLSTKLGHIILTEGRISQEDVPRSFVAENALQDDTKAVILNEVKDPARGLF